MKIREAFDPRAFLRHAAGLAMLAATLACLSCSGASDDLVLGTWLNANPASGIRSMEFLPDHTLTIKLNGLELHGVYKVLSKYRVHITLDGIPAIFDPMKTLFAVHEGKLSWTLPGTGGTQEFTRVE